MSNNNNEGRKYDSNKARWDLLPIEQVEKMVQVLTMGSVKYGDNNWQNLESGVERYYAALMRHLVAWRKGEENDPESGLPHLAHCMTNIVFIMHLQNPFNLTHNAL